MKITNMKKVLIAVDYDPTARKVVELGFSLAKSMGAEVILLHVVTVRFTIHLSNIRPLLDIQVMKRLIHYLQIR